MNLTGTTCRSAWTRGSASLPGSRPRCAIWETRRLDTSWSAELPLGTSQAPDRAESEFDAPARFGGVLRATIRGGVSRRASLIRAVFIGVARDWVARIRRIAPVEINREKRHVAIHEADNVLGIVVK